MDDLWKTSLWRQFDATINMLESALKACPAELWEAQILSDSTPYPQFSLYWYVLFHALFWLDFYLAGVEEGFSPPEPFTLNEFKDGLMPPRLYTKAELQAYLDFDRQKCKQVIQGLTDAQAQQPCTFPWGSLPFAELLLDNLRHVQEHGAQLNLFLGQQKGIGARWSAKPQSA